MCISRLFPETGERSRPRYLSGFRAGERGQMYMAGERRENADGDVFYESGTRPTFLMRLLC